VATQPTQIGRYTVIKQLGEGGMGAVLLARDPVIDRQVAVKFIREGIESKDLRDRFIREAQSAGRLSHVNIVAIFDVGEQSGRPFIVMEYIAGRTLAEIIHTRDPMPIAAKLNLLAQLCDGLSYAHRAGVIHRDIKPANLIVDRAGTLKIVDFGIARLGTSGMTMAGVLMGTLSYMSPEQVTGKGVDLRSDVFAVGAVTYELLTYRKAFPGDLQDGILHRILLDPPPNIESFVPGIDPRLVRIVSKALHKDAAQRYQDLSAMREDLLQLSAALYGVSQSPSRTDSGVAGQMLSTSFPPTPSGTNVKKGSNREDAARYRAQQIDLWLAKARQAFDQGDHDEVYRSCQQIFVFDPDHAQAVELVERSRAAQEQSRADELLGQARVALERQQFQEASQLVKQALEVSPGSSDAMRLRLMVDDASREAEERAKRDSSIMGGLSEAEQALARTQFEDALRALDRVIVLDRTNARARALRESVLEAMDRQQKRRDLDERAKRVVDQATHRFSEGDRTGGLLLLKEFLPAHPVVSAALAEMSRQAEDARRREEEARRAAEAQRVAELEAQARQASQDAVRRFEDGDRTGAIQALRTFVPQHPVIASTLGTLEARLADIRQQEEAERRRREDERVAAEGIRQREAFERAKELVERARLMFESGDEGGALALLRASDDNHPLVQSALANLEQRAGLPRARVAQGEPESGDDEKTSLSVPGALGVPGVGEIDDAETSLALDLTPGLGLQPPMPNMPAGPGAWESQPQPDQETQLSGAFGPPVAAELPRTPAPPMPQPSGRRSPEPPSATVLDSSGAGPGATMAEPLGRTSADRQARSSAEDLGRATVDAGSTVDARSTVDAGGRTTADAVGSTAAHTRGGTTLRPAGPLLRDDTDVRLKERVEPRPAKKTEGTKSKVPLYGAAAVVVLILIAVGAYFTMGRGGGQPPTKPVVEASGNVAINTTPWSTITSIRRVADGHEMTDVVGGGLVTPCLVTLPPGEYNVSASNSDTGLNGVFTVTVEAGQSQGVAWALPGFDLSAEIGSITKK
jgi:serine/threonine protein kinase